MMAVILIGLRQAWTLLLAALFVAGVFGSIATLALVVVLTWPAWAGCVVVARMREARCDSRT